MEKTQNCPQLTDRELAIFNAVVNYYIREAEPVGSRKLAKDFELSPATIRNIMADLEDYGLLEQPHVSAGRVPSDVGYRYFVDQIVRNNQAPVLNAEDRRQITESISMETEFYRIMQQVSDLMSRMTKYAGIVVTPKIINTVYKQIQFIRLSERRLLAIFVAKSGVVQNKVLLADQDFSQEELESVSRFLNSRFENMTLSEIRQTLIEMLEEEKRQYTELLDAAVQMGELAFRKNLFGMEEVFIEGAINILEQPEFSDLRRLKDLFKTFTERSAIIKLLDRCLDTEGVCVAVGNDVEIPEISDMSVVTAKYSLNDTVSGGLGVIGPKRMHYQYVVGLVEYMARALSRILQNLDKPQQNPDSNAP
ncbi:heat-inducible transcription repressor HrcA [bacterium]|nr:heat-inducible transcription repressor HrcA [candidate division CSSED10-310 bacterium]